MLQFTFDQNQHSSLARTLPNTAIIWPNAELPRQSRNEGCLKGRVNVFMFVLACPKKCNDFKIVSHHGLAEQHCKQRHTHAFPVSEKPIPRKGEYLGIWLNRDDPRYLSGSFKIERWCPDIGQARTGTTARVLYSSKTS